MSLTTIVATAVLREFDDNIYGSNVPTGDQPAVPTGVFEDLPHNDPHEIGRAGVIAVSASALSIAISLPAIYWFLRMRRRYRHDLIMMVIISNMLRSFWHICFPVVEYFKHGLIQTESAFCQVSGFFVAFATEQTDFAILFIALHSALSVWGRRSTHHEGGLYPYRYWAYAFYILMPLVLASLAFANKEQKGYTAQGSICYLPSRPYKFINLTWVPRYFVAAVVLVVYPSIYFYATHKSNQYQRDIMGLSRMQTYDKLGWLSRIKLWFGKGHGDQRSLQGENLMTAKEMRDFDRGLRLTRNNSGHHHLSGRRNLMDSSLVLDTIGEPAAIHHPRLPDGGYGFPVYELEELSRPPSNLNRPTQENQNSQPSPTTKENRISQEGNSQDNSLENEATRTTTSTTDPTRTTTSTTDASTSAAHDFAHGTVGTAEELEAPQTHPKDNRERRTFPGTNIPITLPRRPESALFRRASLASSLTDSLADSIASTPSLAPSLSSSVVSKTDTQSDVPRMLSSSAIIAQHERMRRQLRYLFLYPLIYLLLWIAPFISHIIRMQPDYYQDPSFVLGVFVIVSSSIQAGVDCILFSWIERPWRHIPGSDGSFMGSFKCGEIRKNRRRGSVMDPQDVRDRLARQLLDLERFDRRSLESDLSRPRVKRTRSNGPGERFWWEQFEDDDDGASRRRSSNRRVSWVDLDADEENRGRERRRRVSFPDEFGRELERVIDGPRRGSFPEDNRSSRSRSSHESSNRKRSGQEDDWHNEEKVRPVSGDLKEAKHDGKAPEGPEALHDVSLNDEGNVEEGANVEDDMVPPEPRIVETDDHG